MALCKNLMYLDNKLFFFGAMKYLMKLQNYLTPLIFFSIMIIMILMNLLWFKFLQSTYIFKGQMENKWLIARAPFINTLIDKKMKNLHPNLILFWFQIVLQKLTWKEKLLNLTQWSKCIRLWASPNSVLIGSRTTSLT